MTLQEFLNHRGFIPPMRYSNKRYLLKCYISDELFDHSSDSLEVLLDLFNETYSRKRFGDKAAQENNLNIVKGLGS